MGLPSLLCQYKNQQSEVPDVCDKRSKSFSRGGFVKTMSHAIMSQFKPSNRFNKQGKQNYICVTCGRQFIKNYNRPEGDDERTKMANATLYYGI
jgi:hypothetical protein